MKISKENPVFVPHRPIYKKPLNECVNIVPEHIATHGGKNVVGWAIWEWPKVFIEAEFHTIWKSPDGELIDITPRPVEFDNILFLRDPKIKYRGKQINNIRKPLSRDKHVKRYIAVADRFFIECNSGDLAYYHGPIIITERMRELINEMKALQGKLVRKHGQP